MGTDDHADRAARDVRVMMAPNAEQRRERDATATNLAQRLVTVERACGFVGYRWANGSVTIGTRDEVEEEVRRIEQALEDARVGSTGSDGGDVHQPSTRRWSTRMWRPTMRSGGGRVRRRRSGSRCTGTRPTRRSEATRRVGTGRRQGDGAWQDAKVPDGTPGNGNGKSRDRVAHCDGDPVDSSRGQNRTLRPLSTFWPQVFAGEQDVGPLKG